MSHAVRLLTLTVVVCTLMNPHLVSCEDSECEDDGKNCGPKLAKGSGGGLRYYSGTSGSGNGSGSGSGRRHSATIGGGLASRSESQACTGPQICTQEYQPVCGTFRRTFSNPCFLQASICSLAQQGLEYVGYNFGDCCARNCPPFFIPVVGCDGQTYQNTCVMQRTACEEKRCIYPAGVVGTPL